MYILNIEMYQFGMLSFGEAKNASEQQASFYSVSQTSLPSESMINCTSLVTNRHFFKNAFVHVFGCCSTKKKIQRSPISKRYSLWFATGFPTFTMDGNAAAVLAIYST